MPQHWTSYKTATTAVVSAENSYDWTNPSNLTGAGDGNYAVVSSSKAGQAAYSDADTLKLSGFGFTASDVPADVEVICADVRVTGYVTDLDDNDSVQILLSLSDGNSGSDVLSTSFNFAPTTNTTVALGERPINADQDHIVNGTPELEMKVFTFDLNDTDETNIDTVELAIRYKVHGDVEQHLSEERSVTYDTAGSHRFVRADQWLPSLNQSAAADSFTVATATIDQALPSLNQSAAADLEPIHEAFVDQFLPSVGQGAAATQQGNRVATASQTLPSLNQQAAADQISNRVAGVVQTLPSLGQAANASVSAGPKTITAVVVQTLPKLGQSASAQVITPTKTVTGAIAQVLPAVTQNATDRLLPVAQVYEADVHTDVVGQYTVKSRVIE